MKISYILSGLIAIDIFDTENTLLYVSTLAVRVCVANCLIFQR
jgi:hypothetical protein